MDKKLIKNFIKTVGEKNYSEANKYLQDVIDIKIKDRIKKSLEKPLF